MLDSCHRGLWILGVGSLLLTGCSSASTPPARRAGWEPPLLPESKTAAAVHTNDVDLRQVSAYAHYSQAMIYDMEDKPELAQQELARAAMDDPSNVDLVLELTRRYLLEKQPEQALEILNRAVAVPGASGELFARLGVVYA